MDIVADIPCQGFKNNNGKLAIQCNSLYFKHLADYFHRELLKRKYLMMDETPIQVLHEPGRTPESKSYV